MQKAPDGGKCYELPENRMCVRGCLSQDLPPLSHQLVNEIDMVGEIYLYQRIVFAIASGVYFERFLNTWLVSKPNTPGEPICYGLVNIKKREHMLINIELLGVW